MTINEFMIFEVAEKRDREWSSNIIDLSQGNLTVETFVCKGVYPANQFYVRSQASCQSCLRAPFFLPPGSSSLLTTSRLLT